MFTTFLSSENKANDQKKLKKMVEELANKYGKTEDEIFYAYDQWVFFLLKQQSLFRFFVFGKEHYFKLANLSPQVHGEISNRSDLEEAVL